MTTLHVSDSTGYDLARHAINGTPLRALPSRDDLIRTGLADVFFAVIKTDSRGRPGLKASDCEYIVFENRAKTDAINMLVAVPSKGAVGPNNLDVFWNGIDVDLNTGSVVCTGAYGTVTLPPLSERHMQQLRVIAGI